MILFDVGDELKIVSMLTKAVKGLSVKVLKLSLMALRPCYQLVSPQSTFPVNRSKDFLDFWHKVRP